jgi:hypothetical protein
MCQEFQFCADISVSHKPWNLKGIRGGMWCVVQLELERVIGLTTTSPNGLACNTSTGDLAYLAGCVVVVYNVKANCQTHFLTASKTPKAFACVAYSNQGGKFLAAGEVIIMQKILYFTACSTKCFVLFFFLMSSFLGHQTTMDLFFF